MNRLEIIAPWPPSVNAYWGIRVIPNKHKPGSYMPIVYVTAEGKAYQKTMQELVAHIPEEERCICPGRPLRVHLLCYKPDRRDRDLDNLNKCALDSLQQAKVIANDAHIWHLTSSLESLSSPPGRVIIRVWPYNYKTWEEAPL